MEDNSDLTPEQTEKLAQFQELCGIEDLDQCKSVLTSHHWNLESAIHDHLQDSEDRGEQIPIPSAPSLSEIGGLAHGVTARQAIPRIIDYNSHTPVVHFFRRLLAPIVAPFVEEGMAMWPFYDERPSGVFSWIYFLTTLPLRIAIFSFWKFSNYILGFIKPGPRRFVTDPVADVSSFVTEFEELYGARHPTFYIGTYSQALNDAKRELKFMLVYLHCGDHQDTNRFCRETLTNEEVIQYLNENFLVWACSVKTPEGYRVSQALRENTYPFVAVIVLRDYRMTVVGRIEGYVGPELFVSRLRNYVSDNESFLVAARADRDERNFNQALRQEQDEAYQVSLQADREKEARKQRERELQEQQEREMQQKLLEEQQRKEALINRKLDAVNFVPEEPSPDVSDCSRILVRLPTGQRLERRFIRTKHTIKDLYYFILAHPDSPHEFEMATSFPKRTLLLKLDEEEQPTLAQTGLSQSEAIFVYDLDA